MESKAKATGMFPSGALSTKKKTSQKPKAPNKISTTKLVEFGSQWGLDFPTVEVHRQDMFSNLAKNHDDLIIGEVDESST